MTEPIDLDRFRALADAYGGVVDRWPADARAGARLLATHPKARAILAAAAALDGALDGWRVPSPSPDLAALIAGTATGVRHRMLRRARLWWSGVGVATALAGAAAGTAAMATFAPSPSAFESGSAFGDLGPDAPS